MQLYTLVFRCKPNETESEVIVEPEAFRATKFYTNLVEPHLFKVSGFYFEDVKDEDGAEINMLIGSALDGWEFSAICYQNLRKEFLAQHGLTGKSLKKIQKYLDDNDLTMPDVPSLDFPTMRKGQRIRITYESKIECAVQLEGFGKIRQGKPLTKGDGMDEFDRIELMRALSKLDKVDELIDALTDATETMSELIEALDNHAEALTAATKKETDVKPSN